MKISKRKIKEAITNEGRSQRTRVMGTKKGLPSAEGKDPSCIVEKEVRMTDIDDLKDRELGS